MLCSETILNCIHNLTCQKFVFKYEFIIQKPEDFDNDHLMTAENFCELYSRLIWYNCKFLIKTKRR